MRLKIQLSFIFISILIISLVSFVFAFGQNSTINVEANIIGIEDQPEISIEVSPENIDFGDIELGQESETIRVNITNYGNVPIQVIPQLEDGSDEIFENIYFQKRKTGDSSGEYAVGEFVLNISEATSESGRKEYCYVKFNLEDVDNSDVDEDSLGHESTKIIFVALSS